MFFKIWFDNWFDTSVSKKQNPHSQGLRGFKGGPNWARTSDPLIMSQML